MLSPERAINRLTTFTVGDASSRQRHGVLFAVGHHGPAIEASLALRSDDPAKSQASLFQLSSIGAVDTDEVLGSVHLRGPLEIEKLALQLNELFEAVPRDLLEFLAQLHLDANKELLRSQPNVFPLGLIAMGKKGQTVEHISGSATSGRSPKNKKTTAHNKNKPYSSMLRQSLGCFYNIQNIILISKTH